MSRLVSLRDCLEAVSSHRGLTEHGHSKILQHRIVQQIFQHLETMGVDHYCPPPLMGNADLGDMAALISVKYYDHVAASSKPLTQVATLTIEEAHCNIALMPGGAMPCNYIVSIESAGTCCR